ncbi:MAG: heavy-metal-associated domain-containing protein [Actinomycetota bacterium]|nr:heavy-metal-associated domain-containing protein [Actinomycetota bacterium]|tara:strand:+ start:547 stop:756 length:210 start_codon:yes stop_codon:yes gene_type:complete
MIKKLVIPEISCQHCVDTISKALSKVENINSLEVSIDKKTVSIDHSSELDINQIENLLLDQGYTVESEQ